MLWGAVGRLERIGEEVVMTGNSLAQEHYCQSLFQRKMVIGIAFATLCVV